MRRRIFRNITLHLFACASAFLMTTAVFSNPVLNNISSGKVTITQTPNTTTINQSSGRAILNWQSFNIGSQEHTHFQQPAGGMALNRISPTQGASAIYGKLTATGRIILINPAGIFFGPGSFINVGGLIATTSNLTDENFLKGNYQFDAVPGYKGQVVNAGTIIAAQHGLVALVGNNVSNNGLIEADLGQIVLASGSAFTMSFSGDNLIGFAVTQGSNGGVSNSGVLRAAGGKVLVTAKAAQGVLDNVINLGGVVEAKSVGVRNGEIVLSGDPNFGKVHVTGKLLASGKRQGEKGGTIAITGKKILVDKGAKVDVRGNSGGGKIYVGGNYKGKGPLPNAERTKIDNGAQLLADATSLGDGGEIIVWSDNFTVAGGILSANGGPLGGDGGLVETSSKGVLSIDKDIKVSTNAPLGKKGLWLLDPSTLLISTDPDDNVNISGPFFTADPNSDTSNVNVTTLTNALKDSNVLVQTTDGPGGGTGDITVATDINWSSPQTLTLDAFNKIFINANINAPLGGLILNAANISQSISSGSSLSPSATGVTGNIKVRDFNITQGHWYQKNASLPTFSVTNNFQIASGVMPLSTASFLRATGGDGTSISTPYMITDIYGLQGVGSTLSGYYKLANDIEASSTRYWNSQEGFVPIGHPYSTLFTGNFDGNNKVVNNLYINRPTDVRDIGLFGATDNATINNFIINNARIVGSSAAQSNGILVGYGTDISATNNMVLNSSISAANGQIAGMFGNVTGSVTKAFADNVTISGSTIYGMGGLIGTGTDLAVNEAYATGSITVTGGTPNIGGLIGLLNPGSTVSNSYSNTAITNNGGNFSTLGGLIGTNYGDITNSYASGAIVDNGSGMLVGGLLGLNFAAVNNSFWDYETTGVSTSWDSVGAPGYKGMTTAQMKNTTNFTAVGNGFVTVANAWSISGASTGSNPNVATWLNFNNETRPMLYSEWNNTIRTPHQMQLTGMALDANYVLGNNVDLTPVKTAGNIWGSTASGTGYMPVGTFAVPFTGNLDGQNYVVTNLYINRPSLSYVGLLGATNTSALSNIGVSGTVTGSGSVGLLAGRLNASTATTTYSTGTVSGGNIVGGLVGENNGSTISQSYSSADVTASANYAGGLVGINNNVGNINDSYATGSATGGNASLTGGFVGGSLNSSNIRRSYSTGHSSGGGFIGDFTNGTFLNNYWDTQSSGNPTSSWGTGLTTAQMKQSTNFSGWSIGTDHTSNTWVIFNGYTRPMLASEYNTNINNTHQLQLIGLNNTTRAATYNLVGNIDAINTSSSTDVWGVIGSAPLGFVPIGDFSNSFTGTLNGNNYTISNLYIDRPTSDGSGDYVGFFGRTNGATIKNINFDYFSLSGRTTIGGLIGYASSSNIANVAFTNLTLDAPISGYGDSVGGLIGFSNTNTVSNASTSGTLDAVGENIGGLIGGTNSSSYITDSRSSMSVTGNNFTAGGLIGNHDGYLYRSYSTGKVSSNAYIGGLVGINTGSIMDSYATGNVSGNSSVGGLVGYNGDFIASSYSIGAVSGVSLVGGLIGENSGLGDVVASYWDTGTSGKTTSAAGNPGCFSGVGCPGGSTDALNTSTTFTLDDWNFSDVWGIVEGQSYPYLKFFHPNAPRAITISSSAPVNSTVNLVVNGSRLDSVLTFANGTAYFLIDNGAIADGSSLLAYLKDASIKANVVAVAPTGGSMSDLSLEADTVRVGQNNTASSISNANLGTALGTYTDGANILYSVTGDVLDINAGNSFNTTSQTTYNLDGDINTIDQNINFGGAVLMTAGANPTIDAGLGNVNFASTLDGAGDLTINSGGITSFNGAVGSIDKLASLTTDADGTTLFTGGQANTLYNQIYNDAVYTNNDMSFTSDFGDLNFVSTINMDASAIEGYDLDFSAANGTITFGGRIGLENFFPLNLTAVANVININGGTDILGSETILTTDNQTYTGNVILNNDTILNSRAGSIVFLSDGTHFSTIDSQASTPRSLTVYFTVDNIFNEDIGKNSPLSSLTSIPNGTTFSTYFENLDPDKTIEVHTIGDQYYGDDVHINNNVMMTSTLGNIVFDQTFDFGLFTFFGGNIIGNGTELTINNAGSNSFVAKDISNLTAFNKDGAGTFTLQGSNNTYTGSTNILGGTLSLQSGASLSADTNIVLSDVSGAQFLLNDNTQAVSGISGGGSLGGDIDLGTGLLVVDENGTATFGGRLLGSGSFTKTGIGALTLSNAYSEYTGQTRIQSGDLKVGTLSDFGFNSSIGQGTTGTDILISNGGRLVYHSLADSVTDRSISLGVGGGTIASDMASTVTFNGTLNNNGFDLNFDTAGGNIDYAGEISGSGGLAKLGADTLRLSNVANTYTGQTQIQNGTVEVTHLANYGVASSLGATGAPILTTLGMATTSGTLSYVGSGNVSTNRNLYVNGSGGGVLRSANQTWTQTGNILTNGNPLTLDTAGGNMEISGNITGPGSVTKTGGDVLTLSGNNNYTGTTSINAGTLKSGVVNALPSSANLQIASGATFDLNGFDQEVTNMSGQGTITNNSLTQSELTLNDQGDVSFDGTISGLLDFTKIGTNALTLNSTNTYEGTTTITGGSVVLGADNALSNTHLVLNGSLNLNNHNQHVLDFEGSGILTNSGGLKTFTVESFAETNYSGTISGAIDLYKTGSGKLTLSGAPKTYTGSTTINGGTLTLGTSNVLPGSTKLIFISSSQAPSLDMNGKDQTVAALNGDGGQISNGDVVNFSQLTVNNTLLNPSTYDGIISGDINLVKSGAGQLTLNGVNTYSGSTSINNGRLILGASEVLPDGTAVSLNSASSVLELGAFDETIGSLAGSFTLSQVQFNGGSLSTGSNNLSTTFSGLISGTGNLVKDGSGVFTLGRTNSYIGDTTIYDGTLAAGANNVLPDGTTVFLNGPSAIYDLGAFSDTIGALASTFDTSTVNIGSGGLAVGNNHISTTYDGIISGTGTLTKTGLGTLTLGGTGTNTFSGGVSINSGALAVNKASALGTGTVTLNGGNLETLLPLTLTNDFVVTDDSSIVSTNFLRLNGTLGLNAGLLTFANTDTTILNGVISGVGSIEQTDGTLIFSNNNNYSGGTTLNGGAIEVAVVNGLGTGDLTLNNGNLRANTALTLANDYSVNGSVTFDGANDLTLSGDGVLNNDLTIENTASTSLTGVLSGNGGIVQNEGTLFLTGANSYTGKTIVNNAILDILDENNLGADPTSFTADQLTLNGGTLRTASAVFTDPNRGITLGNAGGTIDTGALGDVLIFSAITGNGGLTKLGAGELSLNGDNSYAGNTSINAGVVYVNHNNALGNGDVTVANNSTLQVNSGIDLGNALTISGNGAAGTNGALVGRGSATVSGAITLADDAIFGTLNSAATLNIANTINDITSNTHTLTLQGAGIIKLQNNVGNSAALNAITANSDVALGNNSSAITIATSGAQTYANPVTLEGDVTVSTANNDINFDTINSSGSARNLILSAGSGAITTGTIGATSALGDLTANSTGVTTFSGAVNAGSLITNAGGSTHIDGGAVTTTGTQTFNDNVVLGDNTTLNSGGNAIKFSELLNGGFNLTVNAGSGAVDFDKAIGGGTALNQLAVNSTGVTTFSGAVNAGSLVTNAGGSTHIDGGAITTTGTQTFNDDVVLGATTLLNSNNNAIKFSELMNSSLYNLTVNAGTGTIDFDKAVTISLNTLTVNSSNVTTFGGAVNAGNLITNAGGSTHIDGGSINTPGTMTFNDDVVIGDNTILTSGNGIQFSELLDGGFNLTVNAGSSAVDFDKAIGSGTALNLLTVNSTGTTTFSGAVNADSLVTNAGGSTHIDGGAITTTGTQTFNDNVLLGDNTNLTSNNNAIKFSELLDGGFNLTVNAGSGAVDFDKAIGSGTALNQLAVNSTGVTTFSGAVNADSLSTNAGGSTHLDGSTVTTTGTQTFNDNVVLGANINLTSNNNAIKFSELLNGGFNLTVNAGSGAVDFDKAIGGSTALNQLAVNSTGVTTFSGAVNADSLSTNAGGSTHLDGSTVTTTGTQTFNDNVLLGANINLTSNNNAIKFSELLDGGFNLTVNAGSGAVDFDKAIGSGTALNQLAVNSTGVTTFSGAVNADSLSTNAGGSTHLDGSTVTTTGTQTFNDNVVLGANANLTSNNNAIKFSELLNGGFNLTVNAGSGAVDFDKAIGGITALNQLAVNSTGVTTFSGAVNADSLVTNAGGSTHLDGGPITTTGTQTFNDNVVLGANANLTSNNNAIKFSELLDGGFNLTVNAGSGAVDFDKAIGSGTALNQLAVNSTGVTTFSGAVNAGSLSTNVGGSTHLDGSTVTTTGTQTFNDNVVLGANANLTSNNNAIKFSELLDGGFNLTVNAGSGAVDFDKAIGSGTALNQLAVNSTGVTTFSGAVNTDSLSTNAGGSTHLDGSTVTTTGTQTFNDNVVLGANINLTSNNNAIKFSELLNGGFNLTVNAGSGAVDFDKAIGGSTALNQLAVNSTGITTFSGAVNANSLSTNAGGSTHLDGSTVTTTGTQTFNDNVLLGANINLTSNNNAIKFSELLDGGFNLTVNAGSGAVDFDKAIGGGTALNQLAVNSTGVTTFSGAVNADSLSTNAGGSTHIDGGAITTTGTQTFNDNVLLGANANLTSTNSTIQFSELLNGAFDLNVDAGSGAVNFNKAIGTSTALTSLNSLGSGTVTFDGAVGSSGNRLGAINITGNTNVNGGSVYSSDTQDYIGTVNLGSTTTFDTGNNLVDLSFNGITGNGFSLILNSADNTTLAGPVSGIANLTTNAAGTTTIAANITSTGQQTYNDAVLLIGTRTLTSSANDIILNSTLDGGALGLVINNNGANSAINGVISNLNALTKNGTGTLTLNAANTYTGPTTVNAGRLNISHAQALGAGSATINNATLGIVGALSPIANNVTLNNSQLISSATNTLNGDINLVGSNDINATNTLNINGLVSGAGGFNANGTGSLIFNNSNTYTGDTTLTSGRLIANNAVNPFGLGALNLNGGALSAQQATTLGNSNFAVNNSVSIGGSKAITITGAGQINGQLNQNNTSSTKLSGSLSGNGTLAQNVGTLILDADNSSFAGELAFNGGTFSITNSNGLGDASLAINNGLTFDLNGVSFDNNLILNDGTLSITGNSTLLSALTLGAGSNNTILINPGASFSMNHNISGTGSLQINGSGNMILNGNITNVNDITSNVNLTIGSGTIQSKGDQRYNNPIVLAANTAFTSTQGSIRFANTVNGTQDLNVNVQGNGNITFDKAIGTNTALNTLTATANVINIKGGTVRTVGDQQYNSPVTVTKATRFETTGSNDTTIALNNGINGNQVITLAGGMSNNETFILKGTISAQKVSVEGGSASTNKLQVDTGANQTFTVASNSQGSAIIQGIGQFTFKNIQSLTGGAANDNFIIQNGSINALNGAGGNNSITGKPGINEVWNIAGTNSGQSTSINQFNNIQNLLGGNGNDTFILAGKLTGNISGGNGVDQLATNDGTNSWTLSSLNSGNVATLTSGVWENKLGGFSNIETLQGGSGNDTFTLAGGTASAGIKGGSGSDKLVANTSSSNNNWFITDDNLGQWKGTGGSQQDFADVENLTGNNNNTFKFSNGATLEGTVDGGSLDKVKNIIDVTAYKAPLVVKLDTTNSGHIYNGSTLVTAFNNITDLNNLNQASNSIYLPTDKGGTVWVDGINSGSINDPINFTGYQTIFGSGSSSADFDSNNKVFLNNVNGNLTTVQVNGMPMYFYDFGHVNASFAPVIIIPPTTTIPNVASIIQQPPTNADSSAPQGMEPSYVLMSQTLTQNMNNLLDQVAKQYDTDLSRIKINPYCYAAN